MSEITKHGITLSCTGIAVRYLCGNSGRQGANINLIIASKATQYKKHIKIHKLQIILAARIHSKVKNVIQTLGM